MNVQKIFTKFHTGLPAEPERKNTEMQKMRCKPGPFPVEYQIAPRETAARMLLMEEGE